MKILIADDEKLARIRLHHLIKEIGNNMHVVAEAKNGTEALQKWSASQADAILMDIRMPEMDGLETASRLAEMATPPTVIFTTAYDEHAIQAFEANAVDYLLKPIRKDRLLHALTKAEAFSRAKRNGLEQTLPRKNRRSHLCAHQHNEIHLIPIEKIVFFRSDHKYVVVRLPDREFLIDEPLKLLEQEFAGLFFRVHRNTLVSLRHIQELQKQPGGQLVIRLRGMNEKLTVSRRLAANFRICLNEMRLPDHE